MGRRRVGDVKPGKWAEDDGSFRLLMLPCVLLVVMMLSLVTACSSAGGEVGDGEKGDAGISAREAATAVPENNVPEPGAPLAEPEIAADGRMLQPAGHTGIWFEEEPSDPLERLVYESQQFVGQPVELEPLGDRALQPQWADMPDPCHPEVMRRMGELGLDAVNEPEVAMGGVICGVVGSIDFDEMASLPGLQWGIVEDTTAYAGVNSDSVVTDEYGIETIEEVSSARGMGCVSLLRDITDGLSLVTTTFGSNPDGDGCRDPSLGLSISINVTGGSFDV